MDRTQEAINIIWNHAKSMDAPSIEPDGACKYRGPNGNKCFVGAIISDQQYSTMMEGIDVYGIENSFNVDLIKKSDLYVLNELQSIHDNLDNWNPGGGLDQYGFKKMKNIIRNAGYSVPE